MSTTAPRLPAGREPLAAVAVVRWVGRIWALSDVAAPDWTLQVDGATVVVRPGLSVGALKRSLAAGGIAEPTTIDVVLFLPDLEEVLTEGADVAAVRVELLVVVVGGARGEALQVVDGWLGEPVHGAFENGLRGTVKARPWAPGMPPGWSDARVTAATWEIAGIPDGSLDVMYPIPIGYPGIDAEGDVGWVTGTRAVVACGLTYHQVLVLSGRPVAASTVWINSEGDVGGEEVPVRTIRDGVGRAVAAVDYNADELYSGATNDVGIDLQPGVTNEVSVYVGWPQGSGGVLSPRGGVLRRAGDVIEWVLAEAGERVDVARCRAAGAVLNQYAIDGVIEEGPSRAWVERALGPILPMTLDEGPRGLFPVVWRWGATLADARRSVDVELDRRVYRSSDVSYQSRDVANEIVVAYLYSMRAQAFTREVRVGAYLREHPSVVLVGWGGDRVWIEDTRGAVGAGVEVHVIAGSSLSVTVASDRRSLTVVFVAGTSITNQIIAEINSAAGADGFRAWLHDGTGRKGWNAGILNQERDYTLALRRSRGQLGDPDCVVSQRDVGVVEARVETAFVCDRATAVRIAHDQAARRARSWGLVDYTGPADLWRDVEVGEVVRLNDPGSGLGERAALVRGVQLEGSTMSMRLDVRPRRRA